jgi:xanthosine utilization system XapX-like protein
MLPLDKRLHMLVGFTAGFVVSFLFKLLHLPGPMTAGIIVAVLLGVGKEIYDSRHPSTHTRDINDAIFTIGAGAIGAFVGTVLL